MPQALPLLVYAGTAYAAGTALATAASIVTSIAVGAYEAKRARQRARDAYNASLKDRLVAVPTTDAARSRAYGRVRNADGIIFKGSWGPKKEHYVIVMAVAGHEIDGIESIYFADDHIADADLAAPDANGWQVVLKPPYLKNSVNTSVAVCNVSGGSGSVALPSPPVGPVYAAISINQGSELGYQDYQVTPSVSGNVITISGAPIDGAWTISYQAQSDAAKARVRKFLGGPGQDLSQYLAAKFPDQIKAGVHRGEGIAGVIVEFDFDQDIYPSGVPGVSCVFRGAKVYDPRTGLTRWTENPALIARDWALYAYGGRAQSSELDDPSFIAAANYCDIMHAFAVDNGIGGTIVVNDPLYRCGIVCKTDADPWQNFGAIVDSMAGRYGWAGGKLRVRAGGYTTPVMTITESFLRGAELTVTGDSLVQASGGGASISVVPAPPRTELVNVMRPTISDAGANYAPNTIKEVRATTYIALDGEEYAREVEYPGIAYPFHAQHVAGVRMREARNGLTAILPCNMQAYPLELFDTVYVDLPRFGWEGKTFEVVGWRWSLTGGITLTLKETAASIYDPDALFSSTDLTPNTSLPDPFDVPTPTGITLASGDDQLLRQADGTVLTRVLVTWLPTTSESVRDGGAILIKYGRATAPESEWTTVEVPGDATRAYVTGVQDGAFYLFKLQARSARQIRGRPSAPILHRVIGKTTPPKDVSLFTVVEMPGMGRSYYWDYPQPPADLDGFLLRYVAGSSPVPWEEMIPLFEATRLQRTVSAAVPLDGEWTFAIKAFDTSGNQSVNAKYITAVFDQSTFGFPVLTQDCGALIWPGTRSGCMISEYFLSDMGSLTWDSLPATWDEWEALGWNGPSSSPIQYQHTTSDLGSIQTVRLRAGSVAAGTTTIEYQSSTDGSTYTSWDVIPNSSFSARYIRVRWSVAGTAPVLYRATYTVYA
jgi:hypothetical protein